MASKRKCSKANAGDGQPQKRAKTKGAAKPKTQAQPGAAEHRPEHQQENRQLLQQPQQKQPKKAVAPTPRRDQAVKQDLLARYFARVETLRAYLLTRLPATSRLRRKKLSAVGKKIHATAVEKLLSHVLDTTLVACAGDSNGVLDNGPASDDGDRAHLRETFSQTKRADESYVTVSNAAEGAFSPQSEIVDFVIWLLFKRSKKNGGFKGYGGFPDNVICHGFQRGQRPPFWDANFGTTDAKPKTLPTCTIPGLYTVRSPQNAQTLKEAPWPQLLAILGASAEKIMTDLLLDCSLYLPVQAGDGNYVQLAGKQLFNAISDADLDGPDPQTEAAAAKIKQPSDITFSRNRMFYTKTTLTASSKVHFGLKSKHVLNKFPYLPKLPDKAYKVGTARTAMHIFPRQFGLQNVFTPSADRGEVPRPLHNFDVREKEIVAKYGDQNLQGKDFRVPIPKRLRGMPLDLVEKMRMLHRKCVYPALLNHYCPERNQDPAPEVDASVNVPSDIAKGSETPPDDGERTLPQTSQVIRARKNASGPASPAPLVQLATPLHQVSAFCRAVFQKVVPDDFWGSGDVQAHNKAEFLKKIDSFVRLQRYEKLTLHTLLQGLKVAEIHWLAPPKLKHCKLSKTDLQKRQEIFAEFVYFLFDFLLIPLLATNFYVTESSAHRNQLFYFRHDVWRRISQPAMEAIITSRLEELRLKDAVRLIGARELGFGKLRLLPKNATVRAITNLRHRAPKKRDSHPAASINTALRPVAAMFNFEMKEHPERLGSGMLSTRGMYSRLKGFKQRMNAKKKQVFYFAKVDVMSAFDTIPQEAMVKLLATVPEHPAYHMEKHVEIAATEYNVLRGVSTGPKTNLGPRKTWRTTARASSDSSGFHDSVQDSIAQNKRNTVFVDSAFRKTHDAESLAKLAATHILENIVKIGKKFYRQKEGIPQGSVLSSTLCSYFYADLEANELGFLKTTDSNDEDCLLLRLIDDFLLITVDRSKAARFVEVMQCGHPRYGVAVNLDKSLVNFNLKIDGKLVPRLATGLPFPYCGTTIHCSTLDLTKDRESKAQNVFNSITVDHTRSQGYQFQRRVLNYFQIQSHHMFFDTSYNSRRTTLRNLHGAFAETANKMWAYARCMPKAKRPSAQLTILTIEEVGEMAFGIFNSKTRAQQWPEYEFDVSKPHLRYLLLHAFLAVLAKKQTGYKDVLTYLRGAMRQLQEKERPRLPKEFMLQGTMKAWQ